MSWRGPNEVALCAAGVHEVEVERELAELIRASFLLAGPLLARFRRAVMPPPGGDVIGRRRLDPAPRRVPRDGRRRRLRAARSCSSAPRGLRPTDVFMDEPSVMATENALMAAALTPGHDRDRQRRLRAARAGPRAHAREDGRRHPGHRLEPDHRQRRRAPARLRARRRARPHRDRQLHGARRRHRRRAAHQGHRARRPAHDPPRVRAPRPALASSTATTCSCPAGRSSSCRPTSASTRARSRTARGRRFPADLTSIAVALATQAEGSILVHEWMFENRLIFTDKLILMGADIVMCDPHRAIVTGPRRLRGERVESPDIRAGMAMLLAALCAEGRSEIGNIRQIDRGYERIDERLRELGARIERVATEPVAPRNLGVGNDPPDPQRHARRAARRDARGARDHRHAARASSSATATARSTRPRSSTSRCSRAPTWPKRSPPTACSTRPAPCSCCART